MPPAPPSSARPDTLSGPALRPVRMWLLVAALVGAGLLVFGFAVSSTSVSINSAGQFARAGYCSVPGNLSVDGSSLQPGTFLNLIVGEPQSNGHYAGAAPANFVQGVGITCSPPPPGYVRDGFAGAENQVAAGIYPFYRPGP